MLSMSNDQYETRCVTLIARCDGCSQVTSDGLMTSGEFTDQQIKQDLDDLSNQGWTLVGTISYRIAVGIQQGMDLYYRRLIKAA
jgi:predicted DNA-binding transcriptional regulator YafY